MRKGSGQREVILPLCKSLLPRAAAESVSFISSWRLSATGKENKCNGDGGSQGWRRKLHGVRSKRQLIAVLNFLLCYPPVPRKHHDWLLFLYGYTCCNLESTVHMKKVVPLFILAAVHCSVNPWFLYYKRD